MQPRMQRIARLFGTGLLVATMTASPARAQECAERSNIVVYFAVDLSGSMSGPRQVAAANFGTALIDALGATGFLESGGAFSFSDCVINEVPITTDTAFLRDALAGVATLSTSWNCHGGAHTRVYDAIIAGAGVIYGQSSSKTRVYVALTDGEHGGTTTTPAMVAANLPAGVITELILIANPGDPGHAGLQSIASLAGSHVQVRATTALNSLVDGIVRRTCRNFRPNASFTMSDTELRLGVDGFTIAFDSSASSDSDGSIASRSWRIRRPDGTDITRGDTSFTQTFDDSQLTIGDTWEAVLTVTDNRGATDSETRTFRVVGSPPDIGISGSSVDVLEDVVLNVSPTTDVDGGPPLEIEWDIVSSPPASAHAPGTRVQTGATFTIAPTVETDIGTWTVRARARDNENETDQAEITFEVRNLPPEIELSGPTEIDVGDMLVVETAHATDRDGGDLQLLWEIIQVPDPAPEGLGSHHSGFGTAGVRLEIATGASHAGSWVVRLTARDNDNQPNSELRREYTVLVDAPPEAAITGPTEIGSLSFPLTLSGAASTDPDTDVPHSRLDGAPPVLSPGITSRLWSLTDVPLEHFDAYPLGTIGEVFGVNDQGTTMSLGFGDLETGDWTFQFDVYDGEGNEAGTSHRVAVIEANTFPLAIANGPQRYNVIGGVLDRDVILDASSSYDVDNFLSGPPGQGISAYAWTVVLAPPTCPTGVTATTPIVTVFPAGAGVPIECHGVWRVELTVTDDDAPARSGTTDTTFIIGNCPSLLCLDYPTTGAPQMVEFTDRTDVEIAYHVDSGVYGLAAFSGGIVTRIEIFHETDPTMPVYTDYDFNPLATSWGGFNAFHWNGYTTAGTRPRPGAYDVRVTLDDALFTASSVAADEPRSIVIATADPTIEATSDTIESLDRLRDGTAQLTFDFTVSGAASPDELRLHVYDTGNSLIFERSDMPVAAGTLSWDGVITGVTYIATGEYEAEIAAMKDGAILGTSPRFPFVVVRSDLDVDTDRDGTIADDADEAGEDAWTKPRGAIFAVNLDRDEARSVAGVPVPDAIDYDDSGFPINEDFTIHNAADVPDITPVVFRGSGVPLPPGVSVFLKVPELEDIESIHVFKAIAAGETAFWGAAGSRAGNPSPPLEFDVTQWVDPASPSFAGAGPSGDVTFGLEGFIFRNLGAINPFDGEVDITMEYRRGGVVLFSDTTRLKVAPWMMLSHLQAGSEIWAMDDSLSNAPFRRNAAADPGYKGLDDTGMLHTATPPSAGSQWFQDHLETGYYHRPGGPKTRATFRLPYGSQPPWPPQNLLRADFATFQHGRNLGTDADGTSSIAGSFGGNLEIMPPTPGHPLGRIVVGDTRSDALHTFLQSQEVQPPVEVPTGWLTVGHADEYIAFLPTPNQVAVADPDDAFAALNAIPVPDRGRSVFFATGGTPVDGTVTGPPAAPDRLETGIDHTGSTWEYVRIYGDAGSGAIGQTARIAARGNGFLVIDRVWDTGSKIIAGGGAVNWMTRWLEHPLVHSPTWVRPPDAGDKYVLVDGSRQWLDGSWDEWPAIVTVEEVLADPDLLALNTTDARAQIDVGRAALNAAAGGGLTFVPVPVIFVGSRAGFATGRAAVAFTPGLANLQPVGGKLYFPRQFGPRDGSGDILENRTRSRLPAAEFVDDWNLYHRLDGEVHCGSTVVRESLALDWWNHQP